MSENRFLATQEHVENQERVSKNLPAGTVQLGTIAKVEYFTSTNKGTPGIKLVFVSSEIQEKLDIKDDPWPNQQRCETTFWLTDAAMNEDNIGSIIRFLDLAASNLGGEAANAAWKERLGKVTDNESYAVAIKDFFGGKQIAAVIAGEEEYYKARDIFWIRPFLNYLGTCVRPVNQKSQLDDFVNKKTEFNDAGEVVTSKLIKYKSEEDKIALKQENSSTDESYSAAADQSGWNE